MRIVVVEPYTRTGGHFGWFALRSCQALAQLQNEVTLITYGGFSPGTQDRHITFSVIDAAPSGTSKFCDHPREKWISLGSLGLFLRRAGQELATSRAATRLLTLGKNTVLHFYDANPIFLWFAIRSMLRKRNQRGKSIILLTIHEAGYLRSGDGVIRGIYKRLVCLCLGRMIKHDLDGIIVFDASLKDKLVNYYNLDGSAQRRIQIVPLGMDEPLPAGDRNAYRLKMGLDPEEFIFLAFGVIRNDKRIDLAIEAIKGMPHSRLVIAGKAGDLGQEGIDALIREHGCEQSVTTEIGYIDEGRLHDWFFASDALILPYSKSFVGSSGVLTHACSHGRCVIATDVGEIGLTVKDGGIGFTVEPESAEKLREAMIKFTKLDPCERARIERHALEMARRYGWKSVSSQVANYYQELLSKRKSAGATSE